MTPTKLFVPRPTDPNQAADVSSLLDVITGNCWGCHSPSPCRAPQGWTIMMTGEDREVERAVLTIAALIRALNQAAERA